MSFHLRQTLSKQMCLNKQKNEPLISFKEMSATLSVLLVVHFQLYDKIFSILRGNITI